MDDIFIRQYYDMSYMNGLYSYDNIMIYEWIFIRQYYDDGLCDNIMMMDYQYYADGLFIHIMMMDYIFRLSIL